MLILGLLGTLAFAGSEDGKEKNTSSVQNTEKKYKAKKKRSSQKEGVNIPRQPTTNGNHMPSAQGNTGEISTSIPARENPNLWKNPGRDIYGPERTKKGPNKTFEPNNNQSSIPSKERSSRYERPEKRDPTQGTYRSPEREYSPPKSRTDREHRTDDRVSPERDYRPPKSRTDRERRTDDRVSPERAHTPNKTKTEKNESERSHQKYEPRKRDNHTVPRKTKERDQEYHSDPSRSRERPTRTTSRTESSSDYYDYSTYTESNNYVGSTPSRSSSTSKTCSFRSKFGVRAGQNALSVQEGASQNGLGWAIGVAPCDGILELELSHISFVEEGYSWGLDSPLQLTAQIYGSSKGLAPFASFGVHGGQDENLKGSQEFSMDDMEYGLHGGLGVRYKMGPLSVHAEGRYLTYESNDVSQLQGNVGVNIYF